MKKIALFLLVSCMGCSHKASAPAIHVSLVNNQRSVKIKGLDYAVISEINRDSTAGIWENLLPVYRMPADTDMKDYQPLLHGQYQVLDSAVVFTPDTPFAKGQVYFVRYFRFGDDNSVWDLLKGKKKPGNQPYTDLTF